MLQFTKIMLRSKPQFSNIKIAVLENSSNGKEKANIPLKMKKSEDIHAELVVQVIKELLPNAEIFLLPPTNEAADFIIENKIPITNMSLSGSTMTNSKEKELSEHTFLVTSAGNDGSKGETEAARKDCWCAVGAIDKSRELQSYSSYGLNKIKTVSYTGEKVNNIEFHGTSAAAPVVTSLLAQWFVYYKEQKGRYPNIQETYSFIEKNCEDLGDPGKDVKFGYGLLILPKEFSSIDLIVIESNKMKNFFREVLNFILSCIKREETKR